MTAKLANLFLIKTTLTIYTGWIEVSKEEWIDFDLEATPLEIKVLTGNEISTQFNYSSQDEAWKGRVQMFFSSFFGVQYFHEDCIEDSLTFSPALVEADVKVCRMTLLRTTDLTVDIQCNGVQVSGDDNVCVGGGASGAITKIFFTSDDNASAFYRPYHSTSKNHSEFLLT